MIRLSSGTFMLKQQSSQEDDDAEKKGQGVVLDPSRSGESAQALPKAPAPCPSRPPAASMTPRSKRGRPPRNPRTRGLTTTPRKFRRRNIRGSRGDEGPAAGRPSGREARCSGRKRDNARKIPRRAEAMEARMIPIPPPGPDVLRPRAGRPVREIGKTGSRSFPSPSGRPTYPATNRTRRPRSPTAGS